METITKAKGKRQKAKGPIERFLPFTFYLLPLARLLPLSTDHYLIALFIASLIVFGWTVLR